MEKFILLIRVISERIMRKGAPRLLIIEWLKYSAPMVCLTYRSPTRIREVKEYSPPPY